MATGPRREEEETGEPDPFGLEWYKWTQIQHGFLVIPKEQTPRGATNGYKYHTWLSIATRRWTDWCYVPTELEEQLVGQTVGNGLLKLNFEGRPHVVVGSGFCERRHHYKHEWPKVGEVITKDHMQMGYLAVLDARLIDETR